LRLTAALHLAERGFSVTVLQKGTSEGNLGGVRHRESSRISF
jgi:glycine/D-amino acid oxidase-like deaminating enzyme